MPTAKAWASFNMLKIFVDAGLPAPGRTQQAALMKVLASYHLSADKAPLNPKATSTEAQTVIGSVLGKSSTGASCPHRVSCCRCCCAAVPCPGLACSILHYSSARKRWCRSVTCQ